MRSDNHDGRSEWVRGLLDEYEGPLLRYARSITGDLDRARDVVQDTFIKLCNQSADDLHDHAAEWLYRVCRNRALDVRRKDDRLSPLTDEQLAVQSSDEPSPSLVAEQTEAATNVQRLLETLPANQREVVRLKFQNGLSYRQISSITGLTVTNVGFILHTAVKTLRQKMTALEGTTP